MSVSGLWHRLQSKQFFVHYLNSMQRFTFKFRTHDLHNMPMVHVILCYILVCLQKGLTSFKYVRAEMNVHAFMYELDQKDYCYPRTIKIVKIYVQSQWRVVLLWYYIFWQSSIHSPISHNQWTQVGTGQTPVGASHLRAILIQRLS